MGIHIGVPLFRETTKSDLKKQLHRIKKGNGKDCPSFGFGVWQLGSLNPEPQTVWVDGDLGALRQNSPTINGPSRTLEADPEDVQQDRQKQQGENDGSFV